ncbi:MAG: cobalamin B12-binding domain-containing protein [Thermodesulfobacteriota bacterium]|jgi:methylmalonyl-CoA mutase, C-terminal domain
MSPKTIRILIAKPGLDGHDRGAKVMAHALRDAGMEVIYSGLHQTIPSIVKMAIQESVDIIGLSIMSGAHIPIAKKIMDLLKQEQLSNVMVIVGGVIPSKDIPILKEIGITGVFPGGTPFEESIRFIKEHVSN